MVKIKILIYIVFSGLFLSACDSSGTQEENSTIALFSELDGPKDPEDPKFQVSVVTPLPPLSFCAEPKAKSQNPSSQKVPFPSVCGGIVLKEPSPNERGGAA